MTNEDPSLQYKGVGEGGKVGLSKEIGKKKERIDMLCLQETKKNYIGRHYCLLHLFHRSCILPLFLEYFLW